MIFSLVSEVSAEGWTDEYFDRVEMVNSDSQLYKQAGNGVTVPVIYEIAKRIG